MQTIQQKREEIEMLKRLKQERESEGRPTAWIDRQIAEIRREIAAMK